MRGDPARRICAPPVLATDHPTADRGSRGRAQHAVASRRPYNEWGAKRASSPRDGIPLGGSALRRAGRNPLKDDLQLNADRSLP